MRVIYHPFMAPQTFYDGNDEQCDKLLATGCWFSNAQDAQKVRLNHEKVSERQDERQSSNTGLVSGQHELSTTSAKSAGYDDGSEHGDRPRTRRRYIRKVGERVGTTVSGRRLQRLAEVIDVPAAENSQ